MNYFAHAFRFLDSPQADAWFVAGTAVPDWLSVADRAVRIRRRHVRGLLDDADPLAAAVARGILQHLDDDARFHETRAFAELSLALAAGARDALAEPSGLRPAFLGHLLVEILLDAALIAQDPSRLEAYYGLLEGADAEVVQGAVNRMAPRPTERLAPMIRAFCRERILWDYLDDAKLLGRLNQVMRRVRLAHLPERFIELLAPARASVEQRKAELLALGPAVERA